MNIGDLSCLNRFLPHFRPLMVRLPCGDLRSARAHRGVHAGAVANDDAGHAGFMVCRSWVSACPPMSRARDT